jgi:aminopeptidase N
MTTWARPRRISTPAVLLLACVLSRPARGQDAQPDPRFDPQTGRSTLNFAPDAPFDHQHMTLEVTIPDMRDATINGIATIASLCRTTWTGQIAFDARETISVHRVTIDGRPTTFRHTGARLVIDIPGPNGESGEITRGGQLTTRIEYTAQNPQGAGVGLVWLTGAWRASGDDARAAHPQIFSQGQANWNSYWFPCHDFPSDRLSTEMVVLAPAGFDVVSNGALVERTAESGVKATDGTELVRWHWKQAKPHPAYLVMLAVGRFAKVDLPLPDAPADRGDAMLGGAIGRAGTPGPDAFTNALPMRVLGPPGTEPQLRANFARTGEMVRFFEAFFDEPYPWEKYDQIIVRGFRWGGMENTSATILADYAGSGGPGEHDDLIAHELAHQWTGNLVTCASWEHLWLNEGWATLAEWLWVEHTQGRAAYDRAIADALRKLTVLPLEPAPLGVPMVSAIYTEPDEAFEKPEDPYLRGGLVLHALRRRIGDEAFIRGTRLYIDRHKLAQVETGDLRRAMEEASGESLERFFHEMTKRPAFPRLSVKVRTVDVTGAAEVTVRQLQVINADNPAYEVVVPVRFTLKRLIGGREIPVMITHNIRSDTREHTERVELGGPIDKTEINPELSILGEVRVD